jgi:NADPH2:quinone reductase
MTIQAIRMSQTGGPDVLRLESVAKPVPGQGELLIRHTAIGVNFIDIYHRTGLYPMPLPSGLGLEAAGVVEAVGPGVEGFQPGDRAGYCTGPIGAYAHYNAVPAVRAVKIPATIADDIAAAILLKGMTARYLAKATFPLKPGHTCVVHAAAGGVGQILTQWAVHLGATVIAVVSSAEKARIAERLGAQHVIHAGGDLARQIRALTAGEGADVVYDSVGKDTFHASLDCLKPLGMFVSYGNASGPAPDISPGLLSQKGSLFFTRPTLMHYTRTPALLQETADDLFAVIASGAVKIAQPTRYGLADAAAAHADLESRRTTGSLILSP